MAMLEGDGDEDAGIAHAAQDTVGIGGAVGTAVAEGVGAAVVTLERHAPRIEVSLRAVGDGLAGDQGKRI